MVGWRELVAGLGMVTWLEGVVTAGRVVAWELGLSSADHPGNGGILAAVAETLGNRTA